MSSGRYVIVYRDGVVGRAYDRVVSDRLLALAGWDSDDGLPAYRLRIRPKARLDANRAYREVTGRTVIAGAEKP